MQAKKKPPTGARLLLLWMLAAVLALASWPVAARAAEDDAGTYGTREGVVDYRLDDSLQMIPGWSEFFERHNQAWIEDADHPDGAEVAYEIVGIEVAGWDDCVQVEEGENGWDVRAKSHGTATLRLSLVTAGGTRDSWDIACTVSDSVYGAELWIEGAGSSLAFPGESITLGGRGVQYREGQEDSYEGFTYSWEILDGSEFARISAADNADGSSTATVAFNAYDGGDFYHQSVLVRMTATKDGVSAAQTRWLDVSNDYPELWLRELGSCAIDPNALPQGSSLTVTPEVRRFTQPGKDDYVVCDLRTLAWNFDEDCIEVKGADGNVVHSGDEVAAGTFTLTRTGDWGTTVNLDAHWYDEGWGGDGMRSEHASWWLADSHLNAWLDDEGRGEVFADGTMSLWVHQSGQIVDPYKVHVNVGPWDMGPGEEGFDWGDGFAEGDAYTYDRQTGEVALNGGWLAAQGYDHVQVFLAVAYEPAGQEDAWTIVGGGDSRWINVRETTVDYDRAEDRDLLPGWDGTVDGDYSVWVQNSAHPWGEELRYRVTDVEVISGAEHLSDFHKDYHDGDETSDDYWWYYRAGSFGTVTLKVTYAIPDELGGGSDSYTFELNVAGAAYGVEVTSSATGDNVLPGSVVEVSAQGTRRTATPHADGKGYDYGESTDGLRYEWVLEQGADIATLDASDPQHIRISVADVPAGQDELNGFVLARLYLYDEAAGSAEWVARSGWAFDVRSDFVELYPTEIDRRLGVGQSETVDLELRHYCSGQDGYGTIDNAELYFWFDPARVAIADAAGNEVVSNDAREGDDEVFYPAGRFTITRTGDGGTCISVRAVWYDDEDGNGRHEYWRDWWLDDLDYDLWFEGEHDQSVWVSQQDEGVFADARDATQAVSLSDDLADLLEHGATIEWQVGTWENDGYVETFGPESGLYTVSDDGRSITSNAQAMAERDIWDLRVSARVMRGSEMVREAGGDFWFHLQYREREIGLPHYADMLPGWTWDDWVARDVDVFRYDEDHDHTHETAVVTKVESADEGIATVTRAGDAWTIEARAMGETTVTITFVDVDGETKTKSVPVRVSSDVYHVEVGETGEDVWYGALPGESVAITAEGWHDFYRDGAYGTTQEGLTYEWRVFGDGQDIASVAQSAEGTQGTITFAKPGENDDPWPRDVWVRVLLFENGEQVSEGGTIVTRLGDIAQAIVGIKDESCTYTGAAQTPTVAYVAFAGAPLEEGTDYTVSYANNVNAGDAAQVVVTGAGRFGGTIAKTFAIAKAPQAITAANKSVAMGKTLSLGASASGGGALSYSSSNAAVAQVGANGVVTPAKMGTATITIKAAETANHTAATKTVEVSVVKGAQPMTVKAKSPSVKLAKVKKAKQTLKVSKVMTIAKAQGTKAFKKTSGSKKITVNKKTGAITVAKGTKKGTYKIKVKVTAKGNANWNAGSKTVTIKVRVK